MIQDLATSVFAGKRSSFARNGIAVASAIALTVSGCDSNGPGIATQPGESGDLSDSPMSYREGGVVLLKRASDELADFVTATQFDAVFPMSVRLHTLGSSERADFLKRLETARGEANEAMQRVENAGDRVSSRDIARLDAAGDRIENLMRVLLREDEQRRSRDRARALIEKYPILAEMSRDQIREVLLRASGTAHKNRLDVDPQYSVEGDTSDGDECHLECSITYVLDFAVTEIGTAAALFGCSLTTIGVLGCIGWTLTAQWTKIAADTYAFYTCTKKCG